MNPSAEVIVIGAGPAGMAAAIELTGLGITVQVVDEQPAPGGQVYRAVERVHDERAEDLALLGEQYADGLELVRRFRNCGAELRAGSAVWELAVDESRSAAPVALHCLREGRVEQLGARHAILACGAMERPTPFPGWTLPGVMGVGAAQTLLKDAALLPAGNVVLAGSGPLLYLFAWQLLRAGVRPARVLDTTPWPSRNVLSALPAALLRAAPELLRGWRWLRELHRAGLPFERRVDGLRALPDAADARLAQVEFRRAGGAWQRLDAELLLVHDGIIPNTWLGMSAGCAHHWDAAQQCWAPRLDADLCSSRAPLSIAGDAGGIGGSDAARLRGRIAALGVARRIGPAVAARAAARAGELAGWRAELQPLAALRRFLDAHYPAAGLFRRPSDETIVCRCEEVSAGEIRRCAALGVVGPNQGKAFTRCGMGPCMGRECGTSVGRLIADHHGLAMDEVGHYRIRPPLRPITVGQLADLQLDGDDAEGASRGATTFARLLGDDGGDGGGADASAGDAGPRDGPGRSA